MADFVISSILRAVTGQYKRDMDDAARSTGRFGDAAQPAARSTESLASKVTKLAGYSYAAKKGFDATLGAAISWESAFAGVTKTVDGTNEQLAAIEDGLRAMSKEIPTSAEGLAEIAASAGQLGIETPNVLEFTRVIADLGETTNLTGEQASTSLARLANITGMSQRDFDRLGSTVVDLGNNLATTESEIVEFGMRIAGAGTQIGLTEDEILGLGAALSSVGINAEAGGTAISKVMIEIASQVENGGEELATFARVAGMSAAEFSTAWRDDAAGALVSFITGLGETEAQGQSTLQVLEELGITEVRMRDALLRTSSASDVLNRSLAIGSGAWEDNTALTEEAAVRYDTAASNIAELGNTLSDLGRTIGDEVLPALSEATSSLNTFLNLERNGNSLGEGILRGFMHAIPGLSGFSRSADDATESTQDLGAVNAAAAGHIERLAGGFVTGRLAVDGFTGAQADAEAQVDETTASLAEQHDQVMRAIDPVFNLSAALDDVEAAQAAYTDAVDEYGRESSEASRAASELMQAVSRAEAAAVNGDLSFSSFQEQLDRWVSSGQLTVDQADAIARRVAEARGEAERYAGDYTAHVNADVDQARADLRALLGDMDALPRHIRTQVSVNYGGARAGTGGIQARADGGPVSAGDPYLVGERGPELFVPARSGTIVPNGGGVGGTVINLHVGGSVVTERDLVDTVRKGLRRVDILTGRA